MRALLLCLFAFAGQLNSMQSRHVVHLPPHKNTIEGGFGGSLLELINAPAVVYLPADPPKANTQGAAWSIDVRNLGPTRVTVTSTKAHFQTDIMVGQTIHIDSNGTAYILKH